MGKVSVLIRRKENVFQILIVFENCGSYSLVMKPPFILPNFPVLDISEGEVELIKRAETFEDIFHTYNI